MKKKIAVFSNGWSNQYIQEVGKGINKYANEVGADIFAFVNYSYYAINDKDNIGEFQIFTLPDVSRFDGILLFASTFNKQAERDYLQREILKAGTPTIALEYKLDGIDYFGVDNYSGMHELAMHLFQEHKVKNFLFIGGYKEHEECQTRLRAVTDAAKECGVAVVDENIVYGDWSGGSAKQCVEEWLKKNNGLPDVIICANDVMAAGVCDYLHEKQYSVPGDTRVTGFDGIKESQEHKPIITSVGYDRVQMGYEVTRLLIDKINGVEIPQNTLMNSRMLCGESCGCLKKKHENEWDYSTEKNRSGKKIDGFMTDSHFRHLYGMIRKVQTVEEFHGTLSYFCRTEGWLEGENFRMCLHPEFFQMGEDEEVFLKGYTEEVDVVCALKDGKTTEYRRESRMEAIFEAAEQNEKPGIYLFVVLRSDEKVFGFAMLSRDFDILEDKVLYIWTKHMNQYLEQVRSNVMIAALMKKLSELSVTDALTGVYNRMGCEKIIYPYLTECQNRGGRGVIFIADVDGMKMINDEYGHNQGDNALRIVSEVLKTVFSNGYMIARFGGDEFLIVGEGTEESLIERMINRVNIVLEEEVKTHKLPYRLTISVGGIMLSVGESFDVGHCIQRADSHMYIVKGMHHKQL